MASTAAPFEAMPHGGFAGAPQDLEVHLEMRRFPDKHRLAVRLRVGP
jgi:hypothetical protein